MCFVICFRYSKRKASGESLVARPGSIPTIVLFIQSRSSMLRVTLCIHNIDYDILADVHASHLPVMPLPPFQLPTAESSTSAVSRTTKSKGKKNNVSQSSIFDLKGLVSEHQSTFQKEGRDAVKGEAGNRRGKIGELVSPARMHARLCTHRVVP